MRRRIERAALLVTWASASLAAGPQAPASSPAVAPEVSAHAWVNQTALWPGDRVRYAVEVVCAPDIELIEGDLQGERLRLEGLELVRTTIHRVVRADGRIVYRVTYELATYAVGVSRLGIGELAVRYYRRRPDGGIDGATPAGAARVPPVALALRSTLPETTVGLRDERPLAKVPRLVGALAPVGWSLLLLAAVPVVLWTAGRVWRWRPRRTVSRTRPMKALEADLDQIARSDLGDEAARREACRRLEGVVRELVARRIGGSARALTPDEAAARLRACRAGEATAEELGALLRACEAARYGGAAHLPPPARVHELLAAARSCLPGGRR